MEDEVKSVASLLRLKAEKLLKSRAQNVVKHPNEGEILKLLHELEVYSVELELQNEELLNANSEAFDIDNRHKFSETVKEKLIHEFEVNQLMLEMQNEELSLSSTVSQDVAEKYSDLFSFSSSGYFILARNGEVLDLNQSGARILGKDRFKLKNSMFGFFVKEDERTEFNAYMEEIFTSKSKMTRELTLVLDESETIVVYLSGIITQNQQNCLLTLVDITERKQTEMFREMKREILEILNETGSFKDSMHQALNVLKEYTGFDAVGIRLKDNNDYPYLDQTGFSNEFLLSENSLLEFDQHGKVCRDKNGNPRLGCTCGLVISGKGTKSNPFFTTGGSWWTNNSFPILDIPEREDARFHPRNVCIHEAYASVALVPIRNNKTIVGLIQFNDKRKNCFNLNTIEVLEGIASHIGAAMMRKQAEETLRKNEEKLRTITENAPDIIVELDEQGTILYMNRPMEDCKMEECIGKNFKEWTSDEYHELMNRSLRLVFEEGATQTYLSQSRDKDGEIRWFRSSISLVKDVAARNAILITRDITESILNEEILKDSEEKLNAILLSAMDGFWITDRRGCFLEVNDTYSQMSGYSRQELLTMRIQDVEVSENGTETITRINRIIEQGHDRFETNHRRKDGNVFDVEISVQFKPVDGGRFISFVHDISERKKAEALLQIQAELMKLSYDAIIVWRYNGKIESWNKGAETIYGYMKEEAIGQETHNLLKTVHQKSWIEIDSEILKHKFWEGELTHTTKEGNEVTVLSRHQLIEGDNGEKWILETNKDITERKRAEEQLKESEERFRTMANAIPQLAWMAHADGFIYWYNERWYDYTGTTPEQMEGWGWQQVHDPEILPGVMERWTDSINTGESFDMEFPLRGDDGIFRPFLTRVMPLKDSEGHIIQWFGTNTDVSEIKQAETALKILSNELEIIIDSIQGLVFYKDVNNHYLRVNKFMCDAYGKTKEQLEGIDLNELHTKEQAQDYYDADLRVIQSRKPELNFDEPWDTEKGLRWVNTSKVPYIDNSGEVVGVIGVSIDITERKLAEQFLQESEQRYKSLFQDNYSVMLLIQPETGEIIDANPTACKYYGWSKEEICGMKISDINMLSQTEVQAEMKKAKEEERNHFFFRHRLATGEIRDVEVYSGPIRFGENTMLYSLVHDITERKLAEESLRESQERVSTVINSIADTFYSLDEEWRLTAVNPAAERAPFGRPASELLGQIIWDLFPNLVGTRIHQHYIDAATKHCLEQYISQSPLNGLWYEVFMQGRKGGVDVYMRDITDRKQAEEELQKSLRLMEDVLDGSPSPIFLKDREGRFITINSSLEKMLGISRHELKGKTDYDIAPKETADLWRVNDTKVMETGKSIQLEEEAELLDGHHVFLANKFPLTDIHGRIYGIGSISHDITDRKIAEEALQQSEGRYKSLFQGNQSIMIILNPDTGEIVDANPAACNFYGWNHSELCQKTIYEIDPVPKDETAIALKKSKGRNNNHLILKHRLSNGEVRDVEVYSAPIQFGESTLLYSLVHDVTDRKIAEEALSISESKFRNLVFDMEVGVIQFDSNGEIQMSNPKAVELLRLNEEQIKKKYTTDEDWSTIREDGSPYPKEERPIPKTFSTGQQQKGVIIGVYREATSDYVWLLIDTVVVFKDDGTILNVVGTFIDISDLKNAEKSLKESELRLKYHFENSPLGVVEWDHNFVVTQWSVEAERIFGYAKEETIGRPIGDLNLIFEEDLPIVNHTMQRLTSGEEDTVVNSNRNVTKSGSIITTVWYNSILFDKKGAMKSVMSLVEDITAQKQAEEALVESEHLFRESQYAAHIGSYKTNLKTGFWESSEVMDQIFGIDNTYVKSVEGWLEIIHPDDRELMNQYLQEEVVGKKLPFNKEYRILRKNDGEMRWIHGMGKVGFDENNNLNSLVGTIQDIHDRKLKEEALRKMNKTLAALSKSSQIMAQSTEEAEYLNKVCDIVVEDADFAMVWIGYAEEDEAKTIKPVASAGFDDNYLDTVKVSWADNEYGRGPTGVAIRTGKIAMCNNMLTDPDFKPWREQALKRGYAASIVFPLLSGDKAFGAITIYAKEPDSFLEDEIKLLSKLANDLSHGIITIRLRKAHELAEEALKKSHNSLEIQVKDRTAELVELNESLRENEEKFRTVADFAANWEFWISPDDQMIYISPSCERITGYAPTNFIINSQLIFDIIHPDDLQLYQDHRDKEKSEYNCDHEIQYRIIREDGEIRWIGHFCRPVFDESGKFKGTRGSNKDITARKKMEALLTTSNQKYKLLSENINDGIFICKEGSFEYINNAMYDIFGFSGRELEGMKMSELVVEDTEEKLAAILYATEAVNRSCTVEVECFKKDMSVIYMEILLNYVAKEKTVYGVMHDITEKKEVQKNMVKAIIQTEEKERAYFSKELHDGLGPLLSTIKLYLQWSERPKSNISREEIIGKAGEILEEALSTVKEISNKLSPHLLINYGLNSAIKSFVDKLKATSAFNIEYESNSVRRIDVDIEAALYRAIIECINNSIKYAYASSIYIRLTDTGNRIELLYKDDGGGFDISETLSQHKGLGLFNLQNRIHTIGGKVELNSEPGKGVDYLFTVDI